MAKVVSARVLMVPWVLVLWGYVVDLVELGFVLCLSLAGDDAVRDVPSHLLGLSFLGFVF